MSKTSIQINGSKNELVIHNPTQAIEKVKVYLDTEDFMITINNKTYLFDVDKEGNLNVPLIDGLTAGITSVGDLPVLKIIHK